MKLKKIKHELRSLQQDGLKKTVNRHQLRVNKKNMAEVSTGTPRFVQIEITTACNLKCAMCRGIEEVSSPEFLESIHMTKEDLTKNMSYEDFTRIIDRLPGLTRIRLNGNGEPLINKDLPRMIDHATSRKIEVEFFTNGTLFNKEKSKELLKSGLAGIFFSVDGATKETFETIRKGANFEDVIQNIKDFMELKKETGSNVQVSTMTTLSNLNIGELEEIVKLLGSIGIKSVHLKTIINRYEFLDDIELKGLEDAAMKNARRAAKEIGVNLLCSDERLRERPTGSAPQEQQVRKPSCPWIWDSMYITVDGTVTPCCHIPKYVMSYGNILTDDLQTIWNNIELRQLRTEFRSGLPELCVPACGDNNS